MTPAEQFRALDARKIDLGFVGLRPPASTRGLQWESIARHKTVVVLPVKHPLALKRRINLGELKTENEARPREERTPDGGEFGGRSCPNR